MSARVDEILVGSYDLHVHAGPDATQERRLDALDTGRHAHEAEMAGFVLKSHEYPTAPIAHTLNRVYPGLAVAGSVVLNRQLGGLNPDAVEAAAGLGAKVVWMPTFSADFFIKGDEDGPGIRITDEDGALVPQVGRILDVVRSRDMALASGHVSPTEAIALFRAAADRGIERLIATHPAGIATTAELEEMVSLGAYVEFTFLSCMPSFSTATPGGIVSAVRSLGVDRCVITTDFGQWMNPPAAEGMRMAIAALLHAGMDDVEVATLVKDNPRRLVGLDG